MNQSAKTSEYVSRISEKPVVLNHEPTRDTNNLNVFQTERHALKTGVSMKVINTILLRLNSLYNLHTPNVQSQTDSSFLFVKVE